MHLFGRPVDWEALQTTVPAGGGTRSRTRRERWARARRRDARAAALGVLGCLSFHPRKIVTTGEGGAVTTNVEEYDLRRPPGCATTGLPRR